ncbi:MAG TPA: hypothetical protein VIJ29_04075 [Candidatus Paceibacterota bacterium]
MQIAPYISDRKKRRKRIRAYLFTALGLIVLYGIFFVTQWFIFHSPVFRVDSVVVQGNSAVASADVVALVESAAMPSHHLFGAAATFGNMLLWPDVIPQNDLRMIPQLATATVSKDYFSHTVTITVTERSPFGIWCFSGAPAGVGAAGTSTASAIGGPNAPCYWFDNTGTIFEKAGETQGDLVFVVYDSAQAPRGLDEEVLSTEFLTNFISIMNVLKGSGLGVRAIELNNLSLEEVDVVTANGPEIYFSLQFPADEYLPVIQKLMLQSNFDKLQYIDCRTQNRLFYK